MTSTYIIISAIVVGVIFFVVVVCGSAILLCRNRSRSTKTLPVEVEEEYYEETESSVTSAATEPIRPNSEVISVTSDEETTSINMVSRSFLHQ